MKIPEKWPKLSDTLTDLIAPDHCQRCGDPVSEADREVWVECDDNDKPTSVKVVLCRVCSDDTIQAHPRLYQQIPRFTPIPGIMGLCVDCIHQWQNQCDNPGLLSKGGPGLTIMAPRPTSVHLNRGRKSGSGWMNMYERPASSCSGRETDA